MDIIDINYFPRSYIYIYIEREREGGRRGTTCWNLLTNLLQATSLVQKPAMEEPKEA